MAESAIDRALDVLAEVQRESNRAFRSQRDVVGPAQAELAALRKRAAGLEAACAYRARFDEIGDALRDEMLEGPWRNPVTLESLKAKALRDDPSEWL